MPGTRACSAKKLDTRTGEMPEATFQVCANSMAARRCFLAPVLSPPPSLPRVSLAYSRPPYSLLCHGSWCPMRPFVAVLTTTRVMRRLQITWQAVRDWNNRIIKEDQLKCD